MLSSVNMSALQACLEPSVFLSAQTAAYLLPKGPLRVATAALPGGRRLPHHGLVGPVLLRGIHPPVPRRLLLLNIPPRPLLPLQSGTMCRLPGQVQISRYLVRTRPLWLSLLTRLCLTLLRPRHSSPRLCLRSLVLPPKSERLPIARRLAWAIREAKGLW